MPGSWTGSRREMASCQPREGLGDARDAAPVCLICLKRGGLIFPDQAKMGIP